MCLFLFTPFQVQGAPRSSPGDGGQPGLCDPGLPAGRARLQALPFAVPAPGHAAAAVSPLLARPPGEGPSLPREAPHRAGHDQRAEAMITSLSVWGCFLLLLLFF